MWMVPAAVAAGLGAWRLDGPALWADELATAGAARLPWPALMDLLHEVDAVIGPYYVLMHLWTAAAGESAIALRLPSVAAIVAATVGVTAIGRRIGGPGAGTGAGLFFAILPVTSRYAQEARPYAMVMAAAALATVLCLRLMDRPSPVRTAAYAAGVALAGLLHPLSGALMVAGHAAAAGGRGRGPGRGGRSAWAVGAGAGLVPVAALMVAGAGQAAQVSWILLVTWGTVPDIPPAVFGDAAVGGIALALALAGGRPARRVTGGQRPAGRRFAMTCLYASAFLPVVLLFVAGSLYPLWVARYLLVIVPPVAVLAGSAMAALGRTRCVALVAVVVMVAMPAHVGIRDDAGHGQASRAVDEVIGTRARPGDVLVYPDTHPSIGWAPRDIVDRYLPADRRPPDVLRISPQRTDGRLLAVECPQAECLGTPDRIWVVRVDEAVDPLLDMTPGKAAAIASHYREVDRWSGPLLTIVLLRRKR
jgi:mannosyltransferase